ncbi:uncharacterized protein (DUF983 family) [Novosphingobium chloroacetimidivorans]|uniref:Uncharacterized protein (DUF983 family) n=1 Tax=Novosphingobium chloroacetimidivorans TaxID=1428314 RepID=A0A7W7NXS4_9SPHN|nr:DUF983 domain-containing protein [Novosphingobium chloroacetimidivorans]MBB4859432.1 uncharacterized protein (DUF983 family) [Novosphingobium chloroacetimidivorans]
MTIAAAAPPGIALPVSFWQAAQRGAMCRCPRCGQARLFARWLKPAANCPTCRQDWSHQRADDFPAYLAILVTGHVLAPIMIALALDTELSPAAILALLLPSSVAMMLGLLQPAKGAVIAAQWWHGLHGFTKERAGGEVAEQAVSKP